MPSLGADMTSGTVVEWLVKPGDEVRRGQIVAVVDTDKAAIEVEGYEEGVVTELVVPVGRTVAVGAVLARLAPLDSGRSAAPVNELQGTGPDGAIHRSDVTAAGSAGAGQPAWIRASPLARRRARELGISLDQLTGTGPRGAIRRADVEQATGGTRIAGSATAAAPAPAANPPPAPPAPPARPAARPDVAPAVRARSEATARRQAAVAELMARSKREIPHFYLLTDVDLAPATTWLRDRNRNRPPAGRIVPAAVFLRAVALAAAEVGHLNGHWVQGGFRPSDAVHLGVAISLRDGSLVAPAIQDAQALDVDGLMAALRDLVARARAGRLTRKEMTDPSITVTNLGELGVDAVLPVIYPPQVAMVGFGRIVDRPWAVNGMLAVRPVVTISLAADHRASDGHRAGRFLHEVARHILNPGDLQTGSSRDHDDD